MNLEKDAEGTTQEEHKILLQARQLADLKRRLFDDISHDFRTPLSIISLATGFVLKNREQVNEKTINEKLELIQKQVAHLSLLLDEVCSPEREIGPIEL